MDLDVRSCTALVAVVILVATICSAEYEDGDIVTVTRLSGEAIRRKRSADVDFNQRKHSQDPDFRFRRRKRSMDWGLDFPPAMAFHLRLQTGSDVLLNLERSMQHGRATPMYVLEQDMNITLHSRKPQTHFGVYQDQSTGASVILKCPDITSGQYTLYGSFLHGSDHYEIEPSIDQHGQHVHRVRRQTLPYGDFYGDELIPPADNSGLNREEESPPYPGSRRYTGNDVDPPFIILQNEKPIGRRKRVKRRRRQTLETLYIEYMAVIDYRNLDRWKAKVGGETEQAREDNAFDAMHEFYTFVVNGIDVRFRTATANGPEIRVALASLLVSTQESTSPWVKNNKLGPDTVDDAGVLLDFALWKKSVMIYLPTHDHAGLFTGFDIATPTSLNPIGMGYLNSVCHATWAASEIEETYNAVSIHIAAHELGHNIGTRHDGNGNGCASSSLYLMAPRLPIITNSNIRNNPWTFSTCSQKAISIFVAGLGSDSCLNNAPAYSWSDVMPGVTYSADDQCNMTYGNDAVLCRDGLYHRWDSICYNMKCAKKGANSCTGQLFPFDGTPCGNKKWCVSGSCVYAEDAPTRDETCLFGDDPNEDCTSENACKESNFNSRNVRCCGTCLLTTTQTPTASTTKLESTTNTNSSTVTYSTMSTNNPSSTASTNSSTSIASPVSTNSTTLISSTTSSTDSPASFPSTLSTSTKTNTDSPATPVSSTTSSTRSLETSSTSPTKTLSTVPITTPSLSSSTISLTEYSTTAISSTTSTQSSSSTQSGTLSSTLSTKPHVTSTVASVSTTVSTSTLSTSVTTTSSSSTDAPISTTTPPESNTELTFDLQTMVSLFLSAAVIL